MKMVFLFFLCFTCCVSSALFVQFDEHFAASDFGAILFDLLSPFAPKLLPSNATLSSVSSGMVLGFGAKNSLSFCVGTSPANWTRSEPEAFFLARSVISGSNLRSTDKVTVFCTDGNAGNYSGDGRIFGALNLLENLGFSFFHPLFPTPPKMLNENTTFGSVKISKPYWPIRGAHYHSEHPLDLTEVKNIIIIDLNRSSFIELFELYYYYFSFVIRFGLVFFFVFFFGLFFKFVIRI